MSRWIPFALILACCGDTALDAPDVVVGQLQPNSLHIGALLPTSEGPGRSQRNAFQLGINIVGDAGGVRGMNLQPVIVDSDPVTAVGPTEVNAELRRRAELLTNHGVPVVLAANDRAAAALSEASTTSWILGLGASMRTGSGGPTLRGHPSPEGVASAIADLVSAGSLALLGRADDPWASGLVAALEIAAPQAGLTWSGSLLLSPDSPNLSAESAMGVVRNNPSHIVCVLMPGQASEAIAALARHGATSTYILPPPAGHAALLRNLPDPDALEGAQILAPAFGEGPGYAFFEQRYLQRYEQLPDPGAALYFDAAFWIALAAELARQALPQTTIPSGQDLARAFGDLARTESTMYGAETIADALASLRDGAHVRYGGAYANMAWDADGQPTSTMPWQTFTVENGRMRPNASVPISR